MADKTEIFEEQDPLIFNDLSDGLTTEQRTSTNDAFNAPTQDALDVKATKSYSEAVDMPKDSVEIQRENALNDKVAPPDGDMLYLRHHTDTGVLPRLDADKVETEAQALEYLYNEVLRRFRFNQYDNMIDAPTNRLEVEDAIYDALEEIVQTIAPNKQYDLVHFIKLGRRYRRLLFLGSAKNLLLSIVSLSTSNGMTVSIEDFEVSDKTSDFMSLYEEVKGVFNEQLEVMKAYDRMAVRTSTFSTGKRRYAQGYNSIAFRTSRIIRNGGMLG